MRVPFSPSRRTSHRPLSPRYLRGGAGGWAGEQHVRAPASPGGTFLIRARHSCAKPSSRTLSMHGARRCRECAAASSSTCAQRRGRCGASTADAVWRLTEAHNNLHQEASQGGEEEPQQGDTRSKWHQVRAWCGRSRTRRGCVHRVSCVYVSQAS